MQSEVRNPRDTLQLQSSIHGTNCADEIGNHIVALIAISMTGIKCVDVLGKHREITNKNRY